MQKGQIPVLILVGILIIAVIAGGAYYLGRQTYQQPTPAPVASQTPQPSPSDVIPSDSEETANWKTYTNTEVGFSFKYPKEGRILPRTDIPSPTTPTQISLPFEPKTNLKEKYLYATSSIKECPDPVFSTLPEELNSEGVSYANLDFIRVSGEERDSAGTMTEWESFSITKEDYCITLNFVLLYADPKLGDQINPVFSQEKESLIYNQILSTFRFLDNLPEETGPETYCTSNKDCWCKEFTGAQFIPGKKVDWVCDTKLNRCQQCVYF